MPAVILSLLMVVWSIASIITLYLTTKHQSWRATALPARPWRTIGWTMNLLALIGWLNLLSPSAAVFTWLVLQMLTFGILPFTHLLLQSMQNKPIDGG